MASKTKNSKPGAAVVADNGPVCSKCGTGSFPRGYAENLGLCWTCASPRSPAYFAQMSADTAARVASYAAARAEREAFARKLELAA